MTLKLFPSAKDELKAIEEKSQTVESKMIVDQHRFFLDTSGLQPFLDGLRHRNDEVSPCPFRQLTMFPDASLPRSTVLSREFGCFVTDPWRVSSQRADGRTISSTKTRLTSISK